MEHRIAVERTRLEILNARGVVTASASCEVGDAILDACDEARAGVPFGCRNASCGSCVVEVLEGAAALDAPSPLETSVLRQHAATASDRLACRAVVTGPGVVRIRARRGAEI